MKDTSLRTFGPAVSHEPDGTFKASCTWCVFRTGRLCTHVNPSRVLEEHTTPDWCAMKADMLRDVAERVAGAKP